MAPSLLSATIHQLPGMHPPEAFPPQPQPQPRPWPRSRWWQRRWLSWCSYQTHPLLFLTAAFVVYKSFLLLVALGTSAFAEYDTSTDIFLALGGAGTTSTRPIARKLLKWDAIYFTHVAHAGYVYEQEWAFGLGLPTAVRVLSRALGWVGIAAGGASVGVAVAHLAHLAAVFALYGLTVSLAAPASSAASASSPAESHALISALLHIISPAGIFLSAPYAESSYAALSFFGTVLFARSQILPAGSLGRALYAVSSGLMLGTATTFRSNGVLAGLLFAVELVVLVRKLCTIARTRPILGRDSFSCLTDGLAYVLAGLAVAAGFVGPQALAWLRFCRHGQGVRPWCENTSPSIYTHVQAVYWNVGFLKYWTPNQIPLFLLATPVLLLLFSSGLQTMRDPSVSIPTFSSASPCPAPASLRPDQKLRPPADEDHVLSRIRRTVLTLAGVQILLAALAITTYHVQIINRISSGYPVWYWWVAACLHDRAGGRRIGRAVVIGSAVYGAVQAGLFASFMPPA